MNVVLPSAIPLPHHSFQTTLLEQAVIPTQMNSVQNDRICPSTTTLVTPAEIIPCTTIGSTTVPSPQQLPSSHSQVLSLRQQFKEKMMMLRQLSINRVVEGCPGFVLFYQQSADLSPQFYSIAPHYSIEEIDSFDNKSSQSYSNYLRYRAASLLALPSAYFTSLPPATSSLYTINCKKEIEIPFGDNVADQANRAAALVFRHQLDIPYLEVRLRGIDLLIRIDFVMHLLLNRFADNNCNTHQLQVSQNVWLF